MPDSTRSTTSVTGRPRYLLPAILLTVVAVGLTVTFLYRGAVQEGNRYSKPDLRYGIHIISENSERAAEKRREGFLDRAKEARSLWQPWAEKNKDLLLRLRRAPRTDTATLMQVYSALPDDAPFKDGFNSLDDLRNLNEYIISYDVFKAKGDRTQGAKERSKSRMRNLQIVFEQHGDIPISSSVTSGCQIIRLWATGRITEMTFEMNPAPGKKPGYDNPVELFPCYDFLR